MKEKISRKEAEQKIIEFFEREMFGAEEARKIKKLAMQFNIKLGKYRRRFCRKCFSDLRNARVRINKNYMNIKCLNCSFTSRWKIE